MNLDEGLLTTAEAAEFLGIAPGTLKLWRRRAYRTGPDFIRLGRCVRYSLGDLRFYIGRKTVRIGQLAKGKPRG